ncbi:LpxI family protein [Planctomycetota bacterium]
MTDQKNILGLIAGQGRLPFLIAQGAKKAGLKVICAALDQNADPQLARIVDTFYTVPLARPGTWIRKLRKHNVTSTVMVGRVAKTQIFTPWRIIKFLPDFRGIRIFYWTLRKKDKRNDTLLNALADELAKGKIILEDSTMYCKDHLATKGAITKNQPNHSVQDDIDFGWQIVKQLGQLDIGQAIAVKEKEVIAVEAIEGTAQMIKRAGSLCKKGNWTLIKVAKPNQDPRFDVPCVGPDTITSLAQNGAKCLVLEAEKTIIIDKPQTIEIAEKLGIAIMAC